MVLLTTHTNFIADMYLQRIYSNEMMIRMTIKIDVQHIDKKCLYYMNKNKNNRALSAFRVKNQKILMTFPFDTYHLRSCKQT